jgi:ribonuclease P protein component
VFSFLSRQRIRTAVEFTRVLKQGKRLNQGCFSCCFLKNEKNDARLGIMVSKKNAALATRRNAIKRLIREQFRHDQRYLVGVDVVVLLKSPIIQISEQEQAQCIEKLFSELVKHCSGASSS